jgi:hypothetical protein
MLFLTVRMFRPNKVLIISNIYVYIFRRTVFVLEKFKLLDPYGLHVLNGS